MKIIADLCIVPMGVKRVFCTMAVSTRSDQAQSMTDKPASLA